MSDDSSKTLVTVGRITTVYGIKGWVKIHSYTEPAENINHYRPWQVVINKRQVELEVDAFKPHGTGWVAHIKGCDDRDQARRYTGLDIQVDRELLPPIEEGEYYWHELEGLRVVTQAGVSLGKVDHLIETGSNDVLVVKGEDKERLLPYLPDQVIKHIDLATGVMTVDWDPEF